MAGVMGDGGRLHSFDDVMGALGRSSVLIELAVLALCLVLAWLLLKGVRRALPADLDWPVLFGRRLIDGALFPLLLLVLAYVAHAALKAAAVPLFAFRIILPVVLSLALIRVGVKVLQVAFKQAPLVRMLERSISWMAWLAVVLWLTGLLPLLLDELDAIVLRVGGSRLSALDLLSAVLTAGAVLIVSLWVSSAIEDRLLRSSSGGDLSLRKAVSNAVRALLVGLGLLGTFIGLLGALEEIGKLISAFTMVESGNASAAVRTLDLGGGFGADYETGQVILTEGGQQSELRRNKRLHQPRKGDREERLRPLRPRSSSSGMNCSSGSNTGSSNTTRP